MTGEVLLMGAWYRHVHVVRSARSPRIWYRGWNFGEETQFWHGLARFVSGVLITRVINRKKLFRACFILGTLLILGRPHTGCETQSA